MLTMQMSQALTNPNVGEDMKALSHIPLMVREKPRPSTSLASPVSARPGHGSLQAQPRRPSSAMSCRIGAAEQRRHRSTGEGVRWWSGGGHMRKLTATESNELMTNVEGVIRAGAYTGGGWSGRALTPAARDAVRTDVRDCLQLGRPVAELSEVEALQSVSLQPVVLLLRDGGGEADGFVPLNVLQELLRIGVNEHVTFIDAQNIHLLSCNIEGCGVLDRVGDTCKPEVVLVVGLVTSR